MTRKSIDKELKDIKRIMEIFISHPAEAQKRMLCFISVSIYMRNRKRRNVDDFKMKGD